MLKSFPQLQIRSYEDQEEDVSDIAVTSNGNNNVLLACSQDATLVTYDLRKRKPYMKSEMMHRCHHYSAFIC